jgi:hypothetical protein
VVTYRIDDYPSGNVVDLGNHVADGSVVEVTYPY